MSAPHPAVDLLRAYAVGDLQGAAEAQTEAHLLACPVCRTQVVAWRAELAAQVDALPAAGPLPPRRPRPARSARSGGARGPAPLRRPAPALFRTAALVVLGASALAWGGWQRGQVNALRAEQRQVAAWLAQPGVTVLELSARNQPTAGHLLLLPGREVLFVLPPPTPGTVSYTHLTLPTKA
jgi:anti-sigma factor RsiW